MTKQVKVCCFCEKWESGGIESFLYNVLLRMDLQAIRVDIVAAEMAVSVFTEPLRERGVRFIELSGKQQNLLGNYFLFKCLLQKEKYDVVHLNIFHALSLCYVYLAKQKGVPVRIAHSHNTALRQSWTKALKQILHGISKELFTSSATDLWTCSEAAARFLFSKSGLISLDFQFIPNGIDTARFCFDSTIRANIRRELCVKDKFVVGNVGRLCYQKNQAFLLDIFGEVLRQRPESRLLLIGEGGAKAELLEKAERMGIADAVTFFGTSTGVERFLWAMDVFAFPSRFEGLGIAAVEAQAAGLPVLCSEHIPCEARVTPQFHSLPLGDGAERWAEMLLKLGDAHIDRDRAESAALVREGGFDVSSVSAWIEASYMRSQKHGQP